MTPAIDFHTHLGKWLSDSGRWMQEDVAALLYLMDSCNLTSLVNLDGRWGTELEANLDRYDRAYPGRFFSFCHLNWRLLDDRNGQDLLVRSLKQSVAAGACGLKVWKDLGLTITARGRRILPDDPLLAPIWAAAGELSIPVLIHVADPVAFFHPTDHRNERIEELRRYPKHSRQRGGMEEFHRLMDSFERLVATNPSTTIIGAHATYPENLAWVSGMLARYSNYYIDIAARAAEFGRQPRTARSLCLRYPNRILFGTDIFPVRASIYHVYFRLLETGDEAFSYSDRPSPPSGRWPIYGLDLPRNVLERIYSGNARSLLRLDAEAGRSVWNGPTISPSERRGS